MRLLIPLICFVLCVPATGDQQWYYRTTAPTKSPINDLYDENTNPNGWRTSGNTSNPDGSPLTVPAGGCVYFGLDNDRADQKRKSVTIRLTWLTGEGVTGSPGDFKVAGANGYDPQTGHTAPNNPVPVYVHPGSSPKSISAAFGPPCPAWEYFKIENTSGASKSVRITATVARLTCYKPTRMTPGPGGGDSTIEFRDSTIAAMAGLTAPVRLTELMYFPEHVAVDQGAPVVAEFPPHTGVWFTEFVSFDPDGRFHPGAGVRLWTDGIGLMPPDMYTVSFSMPGAGDTLYTNYALDPDTGEYSRLILSLEDEFPWWEDFDLWDSGEGVFGSGGWTAWGDEPAADATVTAVQSSSEINSLKIAGDADAVRTFEGTGAGMWSFEVWQYIPSSFVGGGAGAFSGSYLMLLNTYEPAAPADGHWSVQMQMQSSSGLIRVFHGDGLNTIDVPYVTDRWAKIQVIVDEDDDWTQVYYDDDLVTEYPWTGGILGGGGGASDIAAVDLYAHDSSSIFYDDLLLRPLDPCSPGDLTTDRSIRGRAGYGVPDGAVTRSDLTYFLQEFGAGNLRVADLTSAGSRESDPGFGVPDGVLSKDDAAYFSRQWARGCAPPNRPLFRADRAP